MHVRKDLLQSNTRALIIFLPIYLLILFYLQSNPIKTVDGMTPNVLKFKRVQCRRVPNLVEASAYFGLSKGEATAIDCNWSPNQ